MSLKIRPGDIEADRETAIRLLSRYVNPAYDRRRFDWLYRAAPAGQGRLWIAEDGSTGNAVGVAGAFPRRMLVEGRNVTGWLLGDFCVAETYRALGPALQLQRTCLEDLAADGVPFCYDFPSRSMEAVYRRLGIEPSGHFLRMIRPLRIADRLRRRGGRLLGSVGRAADIALGWAARAPRTAGVTVSAYPGRCGDEFSTLAQQAGGDHRVHGERSGPYLNWRYLDCPLQVHDVLTATVHGTLAGYLVVAREESVATLVDISSTSEERVWTALVRHALARLWTQGVTDVRVGLTAGHPWVARFSRLGFRPRESSPVFVYVPPRALPASANVPCGPWLLTHGDQDG